MVGLALAALGLGLLLWQQPQGWLRKIRIEGQLMPNPATWESSRVETWFPDQRILFDSTGRQWIRDRCGFQFQRNDPYSSYQAQISPTGRVVLTLQLGSWSTPRRCTLRFKADSTLTRYARNVPLQGIFQLQGHIPTMPPPTGLDRESNL